MKKLLLIRHAKAVHDTAYNDFERPLKHSGMRGATAMAERIERGSMVPQLLVTSPSIRTLATANIFSEQLKLPRPKEDQRIYDARQQTLLDVINEFPDDHDFIGLVGHNPGICQMIHYFTGEFLDVPPGAVALVTFEVDEWKLLTNDSGRLKWFSAPKDDH